MGIAVEMLGRELEQLSVFERFHLMDQTAGDVQHQRPEDRAPEIARLREALAHAQHRHLVEVIVEVRHARGDPLLPTFLLAFVGFVVAGSFGLIPKPAGVALNEIARACLVVAIAAVGLKTSPLEMKKVGLRAFALPVTEAAFLAALVLAAQAIAIPR